MCNMQLQPDGATVRWGGGYHGVLGLGVVITVRGHISFIALTHFSFKLLLLPRLNGIIYANFMQCKCE